MVFGLGGGGDGGEGASVEAAFGGDEFVFFLGGVEAGELEGGFVGLGAAVAEEALATEGAFAEQLGELALGLGVEGVVDVDQLGDLSGDGFDDFGVAVADAADGPTGEHVEDFVSVGVMEVGAFAFDHDAGEAAVVGNHVFVEQCDGLLSRHGCAFVSGFSWVAGAGRGDLGASNDFGADALVRVDFEQQGVGDTAVDDMGLADAGFECGQARFDLGEHRIGDDAGVDHLFDLGFVEAADPAFGVVDIAADAVGVADHDELLGGDGGGDLSGGAVGVDVELAAGLVHGDGGDDGDGAVGAEGFEELAVDVDDLADESEVELASFGARQAERFGQQYATAERVQAHGVATQVFEGLADRDVGFVDQGVLGDVEGALVGVPAALNPDGLQARLVHGAGDGLAPAVDDDRAHADGGHEGDVGQQVALGGGVVQDTAAELDDDNPPAKGSDVFHAFDEGGGFGDSFLHLMTPSIPIKKNHVL